jgi:hypothetical protein
MFHELYNTDFGMSKRETRLRPMPNAKIDTLEHAVQELQDKVQKLKHCIQGMEIHSLECKRMLQNNYDRYDPRGASSKEDRMNKLMRYDSSKWEKERQQQEDYAWNRVLHIPYGDGSAQAQKYTRHWLKTHYQHSKFLQALFKSSKYMDQGATNPYVVLTAYNPAEAPAEAQHTLKPIFMVFETKIETLTQQVSNLTQVVSEWSQKTDKLYHDYLNMKATLNYQKEYYGLPQPPLSNPQAPPSKTFQMLSAEDLQDSSTEFLQDYNRQHEIAIANNWTILSPR